jgi:hypothetical protein
MTITHTQLKTLAPSDLQTALDLISSTPFGFMIEVADNENYPKELRLKAVATALPYVCSKLPGNEDEDE